MSMHSGSAVQINMYPMDVRHAQYLLPHQVRVWRDMVDRIVVTIDTHQSRSGRYRGSNFEESLSGLRMHVAKVRESYPQLEVHEVDYSPEARRAVARYFFGTESIPVKAWDGGPFYSYFYGMFMTQARYIMHFDGDMMFGGGSKTWIREAIALFEARPDILLLNPFPGPPRPDGKIFGHQVEEGYTSVRESLPSLAYRFKHASTRLFLIDMLRFEQKIGALPLLRPTFLKRLKSRLLENPPDAREVEVILTYTLSKFDLCRVDFLGAPPGLWGLHPPYRSETFYRRLPEIVQMVESGAMPEGQLGHYDLNDSIIDWSQARAATRWHKRYVRLLRDRFSKPA
jgi:hypothetical protein